MPKPLKRFFFNSSTPRHGWNERRHLWVHITICFSSHVTLRTSGQIGHHPHGRYTPYCFLMREHGRKDLVFFRVEKLLPRNAGDVATQSTQAFDSLSPVALSNRRGFLVVGRTTCPVGRSLVTSSKRDRGCLCIHVFFEPMGLGEC